MECQENFFDSLFSLNVVFPDLKFLKRIIFMYSLTDLCFVSQCFSQLSSFVLFSFSIESTFLKSDLIKRKSSHQRCSIKIGVLRNFTKFTGKQLYQSLLFNKVAALLKRRLWHGCEFC